MTEAEPTSSAATNPQNSDNIESLFHFDRFPTGWKLLVIMVYFPVGVILTLLRVFIALHLFIISCILRKARIRQIIMRIMCTVLGIVIEEENERKDDARVIIANHVSPLDHLAVDLSLSCVTPSCWDMPEFLRWAMGYVDLGVRSSRDVLVKNAKRHCADSENRTLLVFPEGAMTNGEKMLLKFNSWPFALQQSVIPVVISLQRPSYFAIAPTVVGSRWWSDLLWFFFVPYTVFHLKWLPEMKNESESEETFARNVESAIAIAAGVRPSQFTNRDVNEFTKRYIIENRQRQRQAQEKVSAYDHLATQVKDILPQVPLDVIRRDLERTNSIDLTVSNILEGRVQYRPETTKTSADVVRKPVACAPSPTDPSSWRLLYDKRKQQMIEEHRLKYLLRKGTPS